MVPAHVWPELSIDRSIESAHTKLLALDYSECQLASWQRWLPSCESDANVADQ